MSLSCIQFKLQLSSIAVLAVSALNAFEFDVWKGEKVWGAVTLTNTGAQAMILEADFKAPAFLGLARRKPAYVRTGVVHKIADGKGKSFFDRVEWGGGKELKPGEEGMAIFEVSVPARGCFRQGEFAVGGKIWPVKISIADKTLPKKFSTYIDFWQHPWAVSRFFKVTPFSKEHYEKMRPIWTELGDLGQKVLTVTILDKPWNHQCEDAYLSMIGKVKKADGAWHYDYALFDAYVEFGRSCGIGPDIACYTMCPWGNIVNWQDEAGNLVTKLACAGSAAFYEYWKPFLADFQKHLEAKGWAQDTFIALDERKPEEMKAIADLVRAAAPKLKIAAAGNMAPSLYEGIVLDNFSLALGCITKKFLAEAAARRKEGKITTCYICCSPSRPNTFLDSPLDEARWCGIYAEASGLDGILRWAYNSWTADVENSAHHAKRNWKAGDCYLVYPRGPSLRLLALRDGLALAEKMKILRKSGERVAELEKIADAFGRGNGQHDASVPAGAELTALIDRVRAAVK